jgi:hypothetical protein
LTWWLTALSLLSDSVLEDGWNSPPTLARDAG